jgi:CRP/FNR family cyclic AMP-dependent transcriptional regulator
MKTQTKTETESMPTRVALHPFLAGMNQKDLALLSNCAMTVRFAPGQIIFREGEHANRFYLIESGRVALESTGTPAGTVEIETVRAGDLLGWSWMFPPYAWHFTARAIEPTVAIFFYGTILREYCERNHSLGYELFKRMSAVMVNRLQTARKKMWSPERSLAEAR